MQELHYTKTLSSSTIERWNNLERHIKQKPFKDFRSTIQKKVTVPRYFYVGNRSLQIIHAKMRMDCSDLNYHLFTRFIIDAPDCNCGYAAETSEHYLLHCPLFLNAREPHIMPLSQNMQINIRSLLYGNKDYTFEMNKQIFLSVQSFIKESRRFL